MPKSILLSVVLLSIVVSSDNAGALSFDGAAWVARHDREGRSTGEYFLVIDTAGTNISSVRIRGLRLHRISMERDFSALTHRLENEGVWYRQIDTRRSEIFQSLRRKAWAASNDLIRQRRLDRGQRKAWMAAWIDAQLVDRRYQIDFKIRKQRFTKQVASTTFEEPAPLLESPEDLAPMQGSQPIFTIR
jgi:hypothetical protein